MISSANKAAAVNKRFAHGGAARTAAPKRGVRVNASAQDEEQPHVVREEVSSFSCSPSSPFVFFFFFFLDKTILTPFIYFVFVFFLFHSKGELFLVPFLWLCHC